jgi:hypothetical protein
MISIFGGMKRWQALDYARLKHNTISFFDHLHREPVASRWSRVAINASKVGISLNVLPLWCYFTYDLVMLDECILLLD